MNMKTSPMGLVEIASHEGIVTSPYRDSVGVWTVGIGHTANVGEPNPKKDRRTFGIDEIMTIFARDIAKFEKRVSRAFTRELTQEQFDAAVSFDFNTGGIHRATWVRHFNDGKLEDAERSFMAWSKPQSIIPRRKKECKLFFHGHYSNNGYVNCYPATSDGRVLWSQGKRMRVPLSEPVSIPLPKAKPQSALKPKNDKPLTKSRTVGGGTTAGVGTLGTVASDMADKIEPLIHISPYIKAAFVALTILGIAVVFYARWDDGGRPKGKAIFG